jgi:hypothetical protein
MSSFVDNYRKASPIFQKIVVHNFTVQYRNRSFFFALLFFYSYSISYCYYYTTGDRLHNSAKPLVSGNGKISADGVSTLSSGMSLWQGVAMDSLRFHPGLLCPTFLHPAGGPLLRPRLQLFQGWPANRVGSMRPTSTPLDTPRRTPMSSGL